MNEEVETVEQSQGEAQELEEGVNQLKEQLASREQELVALKEQLALSVAKYRTLVLAGAPRDPGRAGAREHGGGNQRRAD